MKNTHSWSNKVAFHAPGPLSLWSTRSRHYCSRNFKHIRVLIILGYVFKKPTDVTPWPLPSLGPGWPVAILVTYLFQHIIKAYITHWPSPYIPTRPKLNGRVTYFYLSGLAGTAGDIPASINTCQRHMEKIVSVSATTRSSVFFSGERSFCRCGLWLF